MKSLGSGKKELVKRLEEEKERLEAHLLDEQEKSAGLESQLADLLAKKPRYAVFSRVVDPDPAVLLNADQDLAAFLMRILTA